jgi:hypothetical protein
MTAARHFAAFIAALAILAWAQDRDWHDWARARAMHDIRTWQQVERREPTASITSGQFVGKPGDGYYTAEFAKLQKRWKKLGRKK